MAHHTVEHYVEEPYNNGMPEDTPGDLGAGNYIGFDIYPSAKNPDIEDIMSDTGQVLYHNRMMDVQVAQSLNRDPSRHPIVQHHYTPISPAETTKKLHFLNAVHPVVIERSEPEVIDGYHLRGKQANYSGRFADIEVTLGRQGNHIGKTATKKVTYSAFSADFAPGHLFAQAEVKFKQPYEFHPMQGRKGSIRDSAHLVLIRDVNTKRLMDIPEADDKMDFRVVGVISDFFGTREDGFVDHHKGRDIETGPLSLILQGKGRIEAASRLGIPEGPRKEEQLDMRIKQVLSGWRLVVDRMEALCTNPDLIEKRGKRKYGLVKDVLRPAFGRMAKEDPTVELEMEHAWNLLGKNPHKLGKIADLVERMRTIQEHRQQFGAQLQQNNAVSSMVQMQIAEKSVINEYIRLTTSTDWRNTHDGIMRSEPEKAHPLRMHYETMSDFDAKWLTLLSYAREEPGSDIQAKAEQAIAMYSDALAKKGRLLLEPVTPERGNTLRLSGNLHAEAIEDFQSELQGPKSMGHENSLIYGFGENGLDGAYPGEMIQSLYAGSKDLKFPGIVGHFLLDGAIHHDKFLNEDVQEHYEGIIIDLMVAPAFMLKYYLKRAHLLNAPMLSKSQTEEIYAPLSRILAEPYISRDEQKVIITRNSEGDNQEPQVVEYLGEGDAVSLMRKSDRSEIEIWSTRNRKIDLVNCGQEFHTERAQQLPELPKRRGWRSAAQQQYDQISSVHQRFEDERRHLSKTFKVQIPHAPAGGHEVGGVANVMGVPHILVPDSRVDDAHTYVMLNQGRAKVKDPTEDGPIGF